MIRNFQLQNIIKRKSWSIKSQVEAEHRQWLSVHAIMSGLQKPFDKVAVAKMCAEKAQPGGKYFGMTPEEIIASWEKKCDYAADKGIGLDTYIQCKLNDGNFVGTDDKVLQAKINNFDDFYEKVIVKNDFSLVGTEVWINSLCGVRGRMDAVFEYQDKLLIFDWKNTEQFHQGHFEKLEGPLSEYYKTDTNLFTLQLYLYKYMLENDFNLKVAGVRIVQFAQFMWQIYKPEIQYSKTLIEDCISYSIDTIKKRQQVSNEASVNFL